MRQPQVEIFPKQDALSPGAPYGNFINLPLFGRLVPQGRAVFVKSDIKTYSDQWMVLAGITRINEAQIGAAAQKWLCRTEEKDIVGTNPPAGTGPAAYALRRCAQRMLTEGVTANQRNACFRLACQLRKAGLPYEYALTVLTAWTQKNRPTDGRSVISVNEVMHQTQCAYKDRLYSSCGCNDPSVMPFCSRDCPIRKPREAATQPAGGDGQ